MPNRHASLMPLRLVHAGVAGFLTLGVLSACSSDPASATITDHDQDGVQGNAGDCDDFNNTIKPGAADAPGDGVDQDCSGADTPSAAASDIDGDGVTAEAGDCNDKDASVYPGARERTEDGVDADCDGNERPALGPDLFDQVVGLIDTDEDGAISFDEFEAACAAHAMVLGEAEPGIVNTHASCSGTNACRGMMLHPWGELFEHDCRGVNHCAGWSCTEAAADQGRDGPTLYKQAGCSNCHHSDTADFVVLVPPGEDTAAAVGTFLGYSDSHMRAAIAFGVAGVGPNGAAYQNMPAHYTAMSRAEMNTIIAWIRASKLEGANFDYGDTQGPAKP